MRVPPPVLYAGVALAGARLQRALPARLPLAGPARKVVGAALVVAGAVLDAGAVGRFLAERTSVLPVRPASTLVVSGPYRMTRNPMYVGMTLVTAGWGVLTANPWTVTLLAPATAIADRAFIRREERYLERRFGSQYRAYTRSVRRWL